MSTEEGRILFFDTNSGSPVEVTERSQENTAPTIEAIGGLGGSQEGIVGRIKDFEVLSHKIKGRSAECRVIVAGSSDGTIRVWVLDSAQFATEVEPLPGGSKSTDSAQEQSAQEQIPRLPGVRLVGRLIGTFETGNRITCLKAFVMSDKTGKDLSGTPNGNYEDAGNSLGQNGSQTHDD